MDRASSEGGGQLGFDAFLAKPVRLPELEAALRPFVPALANASEG